MSTFRISYFLTFSPEKILDARNFFCNFVDHKIHLKFVIYAFTEKHRQEVCEYAW